MNEFIHTFSAVTYLSVREKDTLTLSYGNDIFFNGDEKIFVLHKYAENGLRIHIEYRRKRKACDIRFEAL